MVAGIKEFITYPGSLCWEWTRDHSERYEVELTQLAVGVLAGALSYTVPRIYSVFPVVSLVLFGGALYAMAQEEGSFDLDMKLKRGALRTTRLTSMILFGAFIGSIAKSGFSYDNQPFATVSVTDGIVFYVDYTEIFNTLSYTIGVNLYIMFTGFECFGEDPQPYH